MVTGEAVYKIYMPIKLHYTTNSYNVVENRGMFSGMSTGFLKRKDKRLFEAIARRFLSVKDVARFFVANMAYGNIYPLTDLENSFERFNNWKKYKQGLTYYFKQDLQFLVREEPTLPMEYLVLKAYTEDVYRETIVILNERLGVIDNAENNYANIFFEKTILELQKSSKLLIKYNHKSIDQIIKECRGQ